MSRISLLELEQELRDLNRTDKELARYLTGNPGRSGPFAPAIVPNPELVEISAEESGRIESGLFLNWLNGIDRWRRNKRFPGPSGTRPMLVFEGDSWFQFPFLLEDVVDNLLKKHRHVGVCLSGAGAELADMVGPTAEYHDTLYEYRDHWKAFVFSGGGNDIVGAKADGNGSVLEEIAKPYTAGETPGWHLDTDAYRRQRALIESRYRAMIEDVTGSYPGRPVVLHGYAHAVPGGFAGDRRNVVWASQDQWIGRYLRGNKLKFPQDEAEKIVRIMIDEHYEMLGRLCGGGSGTGAFADAYLVDARPCFGSIADWEDELHPTEAAFARIAGAFDALLRDIL